MKPLKSCFLVILLLTCFLQGCLFNQKQTADSKVDTKLSQNLPADDEVDPGNPQKGFDQETLNAQGR